MLPWNKLTIIRNRYRASQLREFRKWVEVYFEQSARDADDVVFDLEGARAARSHLNRMLPRVIGTVRAAGLGGAPASIAATDPGLALGGVDVLHRIFTVRDGDGVDQEIVDLLDMAIGVYDGDQAPALLRTFNPLHYAGRLLTFLGTGPRRFFAALGLRRQTVEEERIARLEALAARYADAERRLEIRFETIQDHHARHRGDQARELAELAERVDFVERVLAGPRPGRAIGSPREEPEVRTPV